jgi:hypothetical protein
LQGPQPFENKDFLNTNKEILQWNASYWLKDINQNPTAGWEYPTDSEYIKYYLLLQLLWPPQSFVAVLLQR